MKNLGIYYGATLLDETDLVESKNKNRIILEYYKNKKRSIKILKPKISYGVTIVKKEYEKDRIIEIENGYRKRQVVDDGWKHRAYRQGYHGGAGRLFRLVGRAGTENRSEKLRISPDYFRYGDGNQIFFHFAEGLTRKIFFCAAKIIVADVF